MNEQQLMCKLFDECYLPCRFTDQKTQETVLASLKCEYGDNGRNTFVDFMSRAGVSAKSAEDIFLMFSGASCTMFSVYQYARQDNPGAYNKIMSVSPIFLEDIDCAKKINCLAPGRFVYVSHSGSSGMCYERRGDKWCQDGDIKHYIDHVLQKYYNEYISSVYCGTDNYDKAQRKLKSIEKAYRRKNIAYSYQSMIACSVLDTNPDIQACERVSSPQSNEDYARRLEELSQGRLFICVMEGKKKVLYSFNNRCWSLLDIYMRRYIHDILKHSYERSYMTPKARIALNRLGSHKKSTEIITAYKRVTPVRNVRFNEKCIVVFKDGVYDILRGIFRDHFSDDYTTRVSDNEYIPPTVDVISEVSECLSRMSEEDRSRYLSSVSNGVVEGTFLTEVPICPGLQDTVANRCGLLVVCSKDIVLRRMPPGEYSVTDFALKLNDIAGDRFLCVKGGRKTQVYHYSTGYWMASGAESKLHSFIQHRLPMYYPGSTFKFCNVNSQSEIIREFKNKCFREEPLKNSGFLIYRNGTYDITTGQFREHSYTDYATGTIGNSGRYTESKPEYVELVKVHIMSRHPDYIERHEYMNTMAKSLKRGNGWIAFVIAEEMRGKTYTFEEEDLRVSAVLYILQEHLRKQTENPIPVTRGLSYTARENPDK